jgi:hypothetical protein
MTRRSILQPGQSYTFSKYFELGIDTEDILAEFGVSLGRDELAIPKPIDRPDVASLQASLRANLQYVDLTSEAARRECLVFPILMALCQITQSRLKIEYPIAVSDQLKGNLDYYVQSSHQFLVVEAKQADLTRGFTQLAVELVAVDQWTDSAAPILYGAVTTGDIWKFGSYDRQAKRIEQDLNLYRVPTDLADLMDILVGTMG